MKLIDYILSGVLCVFISISIMALYDGFIITPKLRENSVKLVDIDFILSKSEKEVKANRLSIDVYKERVRQAEEMILKEPGIVVNRYVRVNGELYPVAFGAADDVTDKIIDYIEAIE